MITLRRAEERCTGPFPQDFGPLVRLRDERLEPGRWMPRPARGDVEIVTYVREGGLAYDDSAGRSGVILAGELHRSSTGRGARRSERNLSRTEAAHVIQIALSGSEVRATPLEQRRFSRAERRDGLCIVASPDARRGSSRVYQDVRVYSALLEPGQHVVHELAEGRSAWLHLLEGEATLSDLVACAGDGVGVTIERCVSLTAREPTELLLLDLGAPLRRRAESDPRSA